MAFAHDYGQYRYKRGEQQDRRPYYHEQQLPWRLRRRCGKRHFSFVYVKDDAVAFKQLRT
jgi:hypothetical protein